MSYLTGVEKELALLRTAGLKEIRGLGLARLWRLRRFLKDEKLVRLGGRVVINSFLPPFPSRAFSTLATGIQCLVDGWLVPVSAYVAVTQQCRFRCWHCSREHRSADVLSLDEQRRVLAELQDLGVCMIGFTGGEPLLRRDLTELVGAVDDRSVTLLFTTGEGLSAKRAAALKRCGLFAVAVSLDHYEPAIHDERRGRPGAFSTAVSGVRMARDQGFYTVIQLVATRDMLEPGAVQRYLDLARILGVHEIRLLEPMPTGRLLGGGSGCGLSPAGRRVLRELHLRTNREPDLPKVCAFAHIEDARMYGCGGGFQHLYIDAAGHVCPCDFTPVTFGNVRTESVGTIWRRMGDAFPRPRSGCFLQENADALAEAFEGQLPLPYEAVRHRCRFRPQGDAPRYYREIGCDGTRRCLRSRPTAATGHRRVGGESSLPPGGSRLYNPA